MCFLISQFESVVNRDKVRNIASLSNGVIATYQKTDRDHGINASKFAHQIFSLVSFILLIMIKYYNSKS